MTMRSGVGALTVGLGWIDGIWDGQARGIRGTLRLAQRSIRVGTNGGIRAGF
jgi:hypothetical protein